MERKTTAGIITLLLLFALACTGTGITDSATVTQEYIWRVY